MTNRSISRIAKLALACAVSVSAVTLAATPEQAQAQVAAKVEAQTRPNFGVLLEPPTRPRARQHRRWDYGRHHGGNYARAPRVPLQEEIVLVDCGGNPGSGAVEAAVRRVRPGGTLMIRAGNAACVGWLNIDKPMTIIGDSGFDARRWSESTAITLQAPDGLPCMTVAPGVRVTVRDLVFASPRGGDAACIIGYGAEILLSRVGMRHAGDEAAIYTDGGLLDVRDTIVESKTVAPAIVADRSTVTLVETYVTGSQSGIEITPGAGVPSTLTSVTFNGADQPNNFGPRAIGVLVRSSRDYGQVTIANSKICGFVEGIAVEGASVAVTGSRICKVDKGAVLYNGELRFTQNRVRATEVGVAAASGLAVVNQNTFAGVRAVVFDEPRSVVQMEGNRVWSRELCRPRFELRYRDRYAPVWDDGRSKGYACERSSYPREWWEPEDGSYDDPSYVLDGFDRFRDGNGWYDSQGTYVPSDQVRGDARWRGRWGR